MDLAKADQQYNVRWQLAILEVVERAPGMDLEDIVQLLTGSLAKRGIPPQPGPWLDGVARAASAGQAYVISPEAMKEAEKRIQRARAADDAESSGPPAVQEISITAEVADRTPQLRGFLAVPPGEGPFPAVVMVHEAFGVDEVMRRQIARLAAAGYLVLMPDLFSAGGTRRCLVATFRALSSGQGRAFADIEAARRTLSERADCTGAVGVLGFCMGGGFALMTAARGFDAASVNYGMVPRDLDPVLAGACPIVASYGGKDHLLASSVPRLEHALETHGIPHDVKLYPGAGHSFLNDAPNGPALLRPILKLVSGAGPDPEAAADAWRRIERFFAEHLEE